jgi:hypothetical protein
MEAYADDPVNWEAADPTAGQAGPEMPGPPVITQQPLSQAAYPGETVEFSVSATGVEPLNYQWMSNSLPMSGEAGTSLVFPVLPYRSYQVEYRTNLMEGIWMPYGDPSYTIVSELNAGPVATNDVLRFYRLKTLP